MKPEQIAAWIAAAAAIGEQAHVIRDRLSAGEMSREEFEAAWAGMQTELGRANALWEGRPVPPRPLPDDYYAAERVAAGIVEDPDVRAARERALRQTPGAIEALGPEYHREA